MKNKKVLVIGIGHLGQSLVLNLFHDGVDVVALDNDADHIQKIKDNATVAVIGDATNVSVLQEIGAQSFDVAIICMGNSFEASLLTLTHLLEFKIPHISVRASNEKFASIYKKMGAHDVFFVEQEMGQILAHKYTRPSVLHSMCLTSGVHIVEWKPDHKYQYKKINEVDLFNKSHIQILSVLNKNKPKGFERPSDEHIIHPDDMFLLAGTEKDLLPFVQ